MIRRDTGRIALTSRAKDVVALHVITGAYAAIAHDAGVMVHLNHRRRNILPMLTRPCWEAWRRHALLRRQIEQQIGLARRALGVTVASRLGLRIVRHKQLSQHSA